MKLSFQSVRLSVAVYSRFRFSIVIYFFIIIIIIIIFTIIIVIFIIILFIYFLLGCGRVELSSAAFMSG